MNTGNRNRGLTTRRHTAWPKTENETNRRSSGRTVRTVPPHKKQFEILGKRPWRTPKKPINLAKTTVHNQEISAKGGVSGCIGDLQEVSSSMKNIPPIPRKFS